MRMLALLELARSSIRSADQQVPLFCVFAEWDLPRFRPASIPLSALRRDSARIFCLEHHRPLDIPRLPGDEGILESLVDGVAAEESRLDVRGFIMMCIGLPLANRSTAQNFHGEPRRKIGRKIRPTRRFIATREGWCLACQIDDGHSTLSQIGTISLNKPNGCWGAFLPEFRRRLNGSFFSSNGQKRPGKYSPYFPLNSA